MEKKIIVIISCIFLTNVLIKFNCDISKTNKNYSKIISSNVNKDSKNISKINKQEVYISDTLKEIYNHKNFSIKNLKIDKNNLNISLVYKRNIDYLDDDIKDIKSIHNFKCVSDIIYVKNNDILINLEFEK